MLHELGGSSCSVSFKVGGCGGNGNTAWTCATGELSGRRNIFICIPSSSTWCVMMELLYHEIAHAIDFCKQSSGLPAGIPPEQFKAKEAAAYRVSCNELANLECVPTADKKSWVNACVNRGVNFSCNTETRTTWNPCQENLPKVFPEAR